MMTQTNLNATASPAPKRELRGSGPPSLGVATDAIPATADDASSRSTAAWRVVYSIVERNSKKHWLRVGIAFVNRDGSLNVRLDAVPINGQLHIRESRETRETSPQLTSDEPRGWRD
jgi:hypothetical protein